jgi:glycosyltransferase involved in cell wall biosynthesis
VSKNSPDFICLSPTFTLCNNVKALDLKEEYIMWLTHGPYTDLLPKFNLKMVVSDFGDATVDEFSQFAKYDDKKLKAADVVLAAADPVKVYEYMASGLPVVSTYLPQLEGIADIKLSRSPEEFVSNLDWAVYCGKKLELIETRLEFARQNTWEMRARTVAEIIKEVVLNGEKSRDTHHQFF